MTTLMEREILEIPERVAGQIASAGALYREIGDALRREKPLFATSCARGSSDHAATYLKYLCELRLGLAVASLGPSIASVYRRPLRTAGSVGFSISQSGQSPDLVALQAAVRAGGGSTVAIVNTLDSPLAKGADRVAPIEAGPERAVAATKSFVGSLVAIAAIVAAWAQDSELEEAIADLPPILARAVALDQSRIVEALAQAGSVYVIARGPGLAVAAETALKLKETAAIHAESYSAAEVLHGPIQLAGPQLAALVIGSRDESRDSLLAASQALRSANASVLLLDPQGDEGSPAAPTSRHSLLDPIVQIATLYRALEALARMRGHDPDSPSRLSKVTRTR